MKSFNQFVKELKSMEGLERFNWYVLKPIALVICILVVAFMQGGQHQQGEQLFPFFLPLFLKLICAGHYFFCSSFSKPGLVPGSGANTWKRKANAKDRKRIERTRSQKAAKKNKA